MILQYKNSRQRAQVIGQIDSGVVPGVTNYYRVRHPLSGRTGWWNAANVRILKNE